MDRIIKSLKETGKYDIVFVGDSLTSCEWVHPNWREIIEYVLKEELQSKFKDWRVPSWGIRCFNFGFDGSTTTDIVGKLDDILMVKPDLVVGLMGGNDPTLGLTPDDTKNNLGQIFERFKNNKIEYYWGANLADISVDRRDVYEPYREATLKFDHTLDSYGWYKKQDINRFFTFKEGGEQDAFHPNQLGNAYVAKYFLKEIFKLNFDPEKFIETTNKGYKYPEY